MVKLFIIYLFFYISTSDQMETSLFGAVEHGLPCLFIRLSLVRVMRQEMILQLLIFGLIPESSMALCFTIFV